MTRRGVRLLAAATTIGLAAGFLIAAPTVAQANSGVTLYSNLTGPPSVSSGVNSESATSSMPLAYRFTPTTTGVARLMSVYAQDGSGYLDVYTDNGGHPGSSLASSGSFSVANYAPNNPSCVSFASPTVVSVGTTYWAVMHGNGGSTPSWVLESDTGANQDDVQFYDGTQWVSLTNFVARGNDVGTHSKPLSLRIDDAGSCTPKLSTLPAAGTTIGDMFPHSGNESAEVITLSNADGIAPLQISDATISGPDAGVFSLVDGNPVDYSPPLHPNPFAVPKQVSPGTFVQAWVDCLGPEAEGQYTATVTFTTNDGGVAGSTTSFPVSCWVDNTPPVITIFTNPNGSNGWYSTMPAHVSASGFDGDHGSGTNRIDCLINGGSNQGIFNGSIAFDLNPNGGLGNEGDNTISCTGHDVAGNVTPAAVTAHVLIDDRPPVVGSTVTPTPNASGWNNTDTTVNFTCSDPAPGSGLANDSSAQFIYTDETSGTTSSVGSCVDVAGNSTANSPVTVKLDKTAPDSTSIDSGPTTPVPADDVHFTMSAHDGLSGVAGYECFVDGTAQFAGTDLCQSPFTLAPGTPAGLHTFTAQAVDQAGNVDPEAASYDFTTLTPVNVHVTGTQVIGGPATFSIGGPVPDGLSGAITCSTVNGGTPVDADLGLGTYSLDVASCSGLTADATHYLRLTAGDYVVTKIPVTVTVQGSEAYGATASFSVDGGLPAGVSGAPSCTVVDGSVTVGLSTLSVGSHPILAASCSGLVGDATHDVQIVGGALVVTPVPLTITASDGQQTYGDTTGPTITPDVVGLVGGEQPSVLVGLTCTAHVDATTHVGHYRGATDCSGASDANYTYTYVKGAAVVARAPLTVSVAPAARNYGDADPAFTITFTGLRNSDDPSVVTGTPTVTATRTRNVGGVWTAVPSSPTSPVGVYVTRVTGLAASDYRLTYAAGTMTVNPAPLIIGARPSTRLYGHPDPVFRLTYHGGFVNGEGPEVLGGTVSVTAFTRRIIGGLPMLIPSSLTSPPGLYTVRVSGLTSPNYAIHFVAGTMEVLDSPTVTSVRPPRGPWYGGTKITIIGSQFTTGDTVVIGQGGGISSALPLTDVTIVSPSRITGITPYGGRFGRWHVFVVTYDGHVSPRNDAATFAFR